MDKKKKGTEVKYFAQSHIASRWQFLNPVNLLQSIILPTPLLQHRWVMAKFLKKKKKVEVCSRNWISDHVYLGQAT